MAAAGTTQAAAPNANTNHIQIKQVFVKTVFLVPRDAAAPPTNYYSLMARHLRWCQARYRELLFDQDKEDYRLLMLNRRAFPNLHLTDRQYRPPGYSLFKKVMMLPAIKLPGQPDYTGPWNGLEK